MKNKLHTLDELNKILTIFDEYRFNESMFLDDDDNCEMRLLEYNYSEVPITKFNFFKLKFQTITKYKINYLLFKMNDGSIKYVNYNEHLIHALLILHLNHIIVHNNPEIITLK